MLSAEQNALVTLTGPNAPAGALMRRYWQPAALTEEFADARPVVPVRLMGEDLVAFRTEDGQYRLTARRCPHRGADLSYARLEDGGIRCPFHGWLFDGKGGCLQQPAEPAGSDFHTKISMPAYPCLERNGVVFAYLGPGDAPPLPDFDCFAAPDAYTFAFKGFLECNWLQALEVGVDPVHGSYLHRFFEDEDPDSGYGLQFRDLVDGADVPLTTIMREHPAPDIEIEDTGFGMRMLALRDLDAVTRHVRVTNLLFPNAIVIPLGNDMIISQWHVPIDDTHCWWYAMFTSYASPLDKQEMRAQRLKLYTLPDYKPRANKTNNYGFDAAEQHALTYTGMGVDINVHDQWAVESQGSIHDRTSENLGVSDMAIATFRRSLIRAIEAVRKGVPAPKVPNGAPAPKVPNGAPAPKVPNGAPAPKVPNGAPAPKVPAPKVPNGAPADLPLAVDTVARPDGWQEAWRAIDAARRAGSAWAGSTGAGPAGTGSAGAKS